MKPVKSTRYVEKLRTRSTFSVICQAGSSPRFRRTTDEKKCAIESALVQAKASQASDVGSIPIARSRNPVDAVGFTGFHSQERPIKSLVLDADGRGARSH